MKYRELRDRLNAMPDDQLHFTVTPIAAIRLTDAEMISASRGNLKLMGEDYALLIGMSH